MGKTRSGKQHVGNIAPSGRPTGGQNRTSGRKQKQVGDDSHKGAPPSPNTAPMPTIRIGFKIKCKNDDPMTRYQLVLKARITNRVYVVTNTKYNKDFCLKVEPFDAVHELKQLRRDLFIMCDAKKYPTTLGSHFFPVTNKGCVEDLFNYIVMPLGEANLADIRKNTANGEFSFETATRLAIETFQAINDLHTLSYIHRAIGPSKFVVGPEGNRIYLVGLSLSMCMYKLSKSSTPRHIHKYGPSRFQSCNWHRRREQHYKDDLESWMYMAVDFFARKNLPWNEGMLDVTMVELKEQFLNGGHECSPSSLPKHMKTIIQRMGCLRGGEKPDYRFFKRILTQMRNEVRCDMKGPYNWDAQKPVLDKGCNEKDQVVSERIVELPEPEPKKEESLMAAPIPPSEKDQETEESPFVSGDVTRQDDSELEFKGKSNKWKRNKAKEINVVQKIFEQPLVTINDFPADTVKVEKVDKVKTLAEKKDEEKGSSMEVTEVTAKADEEEEKSKIIVSRKQLDEEEGDNNDL